MTDSRPPNIDFRAHGEKGRPEVIEICNELLIGEYPRVEDVAWLRKAFGVSAIHSLQDNYDLACRGLDLASLTETCLASGVELARTPVADDSGPDLALHLGELLDVLGSLLGQGHRVYLHCNGCLNRAPTVAAAFMCLHKRMSVDDAVAYLKQRRICFPDTIVLAEYFNARRLDL
jgi:protein-tyrosine phosphatase